MKTFTLAVLYIVVREALSVPITLLVASVENHLLVLRRRAPILLPAGDGESDESEFLLDARHEGQAPQIDGKVILTDGAAAPGELRRAWVTQTSAFDLVATLDPLQVVDP